MKALLHSVFGLLPLLCLASQLSFENKSLELPCELGQKEIIAVFPFENKGEEPIAIVHIRSTCGCTVAEWEKKEYAPGEKGEVRAVFTIGDRVGLQRKALEVITDEEDDDTTRLTLSTTIPELGKVRPAVVLWDSDHEGVEKRVRLITHPGVRWKILDPLVSFPFRVREIKSEKKDQISLGITPKSGSSVPRAKLRFQFTNDEGMSETKNLHLLVKTPSSPKD